MNKIIILLLLPVFALSSCVSVPEGFGLENPGQYSRIYIAASYNGAHSEEMQAPKDAEVSIWANYSGVIALGSDVDVQLGSDLKKVDGYNERQGTDYAPIDEDCFSLRVDKVTIPAGQTISSSAAIVEFYSEKFTDERIHVLPVSIIGVSNSSIALSEDLATLYIAVRCKAAALEIFTDSLTDFDISQTEKW